MVLSVRDIIGENTRFSELHADIRESKWAVLIEMALVAYAKIFISEIVEEKNT